MDTVISGAESGNNASTSDGHYTLTKNSPHSFLPGHLLSHPFEEFSVMGYCALHKDVFL